MSLTSTNIYNTFGNQVSVKIAHDTLVQYIENSTVGFPLPEASVDILKNLLTEQHSVNAQQLEQLTSQLESRGFGKANATALSTILVQVAAQQGVDPISYFNANTHTLKLTMDAYDAMNRLRPPGNQVGLVAAKNNARSSLRPLIQP